MRQHEGVHEIGLETGKCMGEVVASREAGKGKERNVSVSRLFFDVGGDWGSIVTFSPSVFMDWMGWVSWTQRWSYSERVP